MREGWGGSGVIWDVGGLGAVNCRFDVEQESVNLSRLAFVDVGVVDASDRAIFLPFISIIVFDEGRNLLIARADWDRIERDADAKVGADFAHRIPEAFEIEALVLAA